MKLAEALQERADINKRISELRRRLENCLLVQEGEESLRPDRVRAHSNCNVSLPDMNCKTRVA